MSTAAKELVPFSQARATLSELADEVKQGSEEIITKNGESYVALIDADRLDYRSWTGTTRRCSKGTSRWRLRSSSRKTGPTCRSLAAAA
jgi:prevent-host-death family protein